MSVAVGFSAEVLHLNSAAAAAHIEAAIRDAVFQRLRRRGAVVAISGGIDSSVVAALCARALGPDRVLGLMLPEADSSPESLRLAQSLATSLAIRTQVEDIGGILAEAGCYRRRDEAIRQVIPEYGDGYKCKIVLPDMLRNNAYAVFSVVVQSPSGQRTKARLSLEAYLGVVAATNFKQRTRKMMEYYYADRFNYAVAGTPNRLEYDQGFFVKNGDGAADLKPIAHLYKSQVYELAAYLGVPEDGSVPLWEESLYTAGRSCSYRGPDGRSGRSRLSSDRFHSKRHSVSSPGADIVRRRAGSRILNRNLGMHTKTGTNR
jgi:NAD+ synthase